MSNLRIKDFSTAEVGVDNCIYKATLTSDTANTVDGLGLGINGADWSSAPAEYDFETLGAIKNVAEATGNLLTFTVPAALRAGLGGAHYVEYKLVLSEVVAKRLGADEFMRADSTADSVGGVWLQLINWNDVGTAYQDQFVDNQLNYVFGGPGVQIRMESGTKAPNQAVPYTVLHPQIETDSLGKFTVGVSVGGQKIYLYINGILAGVQWRGVGNANFQIAEDCVGFSFGRKVVMHMSDFMVYDKPLPEPYNDAVRIAVYGHSFLSRDNLPYVDKTGTPGGSQAWGCIDSISSKLFSDLNFEFDFRNINLGGTGLGHFMTYRIEGAALEYNNAAPATYEGDMERQDPHFCVIYGPLYNTYTGGTAGFTSLTDGLSQICAYTMARGIIPVIMLEQNSTGSTSTKASVTPEYTECIAEINRQLAVNDMGLVDMYQATGGTQVLDTYVQSNDGSSESHPNFKSQSLAGTLLAAEINRLYANPPSYSKFNGRNYIVNPIAAAS